VTTIFYDGKNLYADRRIMHDCYPSQMDNTGRKLHINESNTIAIGTSGKIPDAKEQKRMCRIADLTFKQMYAGHLNHRIELKETVAGKVINVMEDLEDFIAITSNKAFVYQNNNVYPQTGFMTALGTGRRSIIGCYYVVRDVATAFRISADLDSLSSPEYMYVMADSLNPYVVE
jgi:hypothetical protein